MEPYRGSLKKPARELRGGMTDAERALWQRIRRQQILGVHFYRQKPLLSFIVDFYCPKAKLVVELDGSQHHEPEHRIRDEQRDAKLNALGIRVLRFDNRTVLREPGSVLELIRRAVADALDPHDRP